MKNQSGFTLLELIVVLAILGIILSIAVPNYLGIHETAGNNAQEVQAGLIAKSMKQEFADDFASVDEGTSELNVEDTDGSSMKVIGGKIDDSTAPIRGHLCFTYVEDGDTSYPYFHFKIYADTDTLAIKYVKSADDIIDDLPDYATVNYY